MEIREQIQLLKELIQQNQVTQEAMRQTLIDLENRRQATAQRHSLTAPHPATTAPNLVPVENSPRS